MTGRSLSVLASGSHEIRVLVQPISVAIGERFHVPLVRSTMEASMNWVTRKNAAVDRIACPWLIKRFIDPEAEFLYVASQEVARVA